MSTELDTLAAALETAKITEENARAKRVDAELALVRALGCKEEGASTHRGSGYKVTITGVINRRVDAAALDAVRERLSPAMFERAFRYRPEAIDAGVRYLRDNEPALYAIASEAITAQPGKPSVRLERIERAAEAA